MKSRLVIKQCVGYIFCGDFSISINISIIDTHDINVNKLIIIWSSLLL